MAGAYILGFSLAVLLLATCVVADDRLPRPMAPSSSCLNPQSNSSVACHPPPKRCPQLDHVIYVVMENQAATGILDPATFPHIVDISKRFSLAKQYYGYTHVSEPNYLAMVAGTNACNFDDSYQIYDGKNITNLFSQLLEKNKSFKCYSQGLPYSGYIGASFPSEALYAHKHNPCSMLSVSQAPQYNANFEQFLDDLYTDNLPLFSFVAPDQCHDNHGFGTTGAIQGTVSPCTGAQLFKNGDDFVKTFFDRLQSTRTWREKKTLVVLVWDENDFQSQGGCCGSPIPPNGQIWAPGNAVNCPWSPQCRQNPSAYPQCDHVYTGYTAKTDGSVYGGGNTVAVYAYSKAEGRCDLDYPMNHLSTLKTLEYCWGLPFANNAALDNVPFVDECIFQ